MVVTTFLIVENIFCEAKGLTEQERDASFLLYNNILNFFYKDILWNSSRFHRILTFTKT